MNVAQLRDLLAMNEGLKLDFKREYRLIQPKALNSTKDWKDLVNGQWHELIKDVIALANGNIGVPNQTGYLIVGVDDTLQPDGTRELHDASHLNLTTQQIIAKVNRVCEPPLPDIHCEQLVFEGKTIYVISIPPTPYVHETNQPLTVTSGIFDGTDKLVKLGKPTVYTEYTAFIRKGESTFPASANERRALETDKRFDLIVMEENLKFELINNLKIMLSRSKTSGLYSPTIYYQGFRNEYTISVDKDLYVKGRHLKWLVVAVLLVGTSKNLSTRFIELAINSGRYLMYSPQVGKHERSEFLRYLYELYVNIERLINAVEHENRNGFMVKYPVKTLGDDTEVTVQNFDIVMTAAMLDRFEDVLHLSSALLAYLLGDKASLEKINLNDGSPIEGMSHKIAAETPTDSDIIEWVLNRP